MNDQEKIYIDWPWRYFQSNWSWKLTRSISLQLYMINHLIITSEKISNNLAGKNSIQNYIPETSSIKYAKTCQKNKIENLGLSTVTKGESVGLYFRRNGFKYEEYPCFWQLKFIIIGASKPHFYTRPIFYHPLYSTQPEIYSTKFGKIEISCLELNAQFLEKIKNFPFVKF